MHFNAGVSTSNRAGLNFFLGVRIDENQMERKKCICMAFQRSHEGVVN